MAAELAARIAMLTERDVSAVRVIGGQHGYQHLDIEFADGSRGFGKTAASAPAASSPAASSPADGATFAAEASGLRWLAAAAAVPVPEVLGVDETALVIDMIPRSGPVDQDAAYRFGGELARLHATGSPWGFGAPWPGFIASLPLDNGPGTSWPAWYAERRLLPFARLAVDSGALRSADMALVTAVADRIDSLAGPAAAEPPSRIHGDCWSGNVLWSHGRGWLIDPAAHAGHRETDLAMLALFGAPRLPDVLAGYRAVAPLADGWQARVPLHQLHPLLVHACLFGASYRSAVRAAARTLLQLSPSQLPGVRIAGLVH